MQPSAAPAPVRTPSHRSVLYLPARLAAAVRALFSSVFEVEIETGPQRKLRTAVRQREEMARRQMAEMPLPTLTDAHGCIDCSAIFRPILHDAEKRCQVCGSQSTFDLVPPLNRGMNVPAQNVVPFRAPVKGQGKGGAA